MRTPTLVILDHDAGRALRLMDGRSFSWFYVGQSFQRRERASRVLREENRHMIGDLLREVAIQQKQPFIDFVAELGMAQQDSLLWWASSLAHKEPGASDLFLLWCQSHVFERVQSEWESQRDRPLVAVLENPWLYRYLRKQHEKDEAMAFVSRDSLLPQVLKLTLRGMAGRGHFLLTAIRHGWQTRRMVSRPGAGDHRDTTKGVYLYSWVQDRFFQGKDGFQDAYWGRLPQWMTGNGFEVTYVTPLFWPSRLKRKCLDYGKFVFIFLDRYITPGVVLKCLFSYLAVRLPPGRSSLEPLVQRERLRQLSALPYNLLYYFAFRNWLGRNREKMTILYPFENQPWERLLCLAAGEKAGGIRLVAYQHSTVPPLSLQYFPGKGESGGMPHPDVVVTSGGYELDMLQNSGYDGVRFVNGGALRYEYLHHIARVAKRHDTGPKAVLVALPYWRNLAAELLAGLLRAFGDSDDLRFVVKAHPTLPLEKLWPYLPPWPRHFERTDRPMPEIMGDIDLMVYSSTTAGVEALVSGVPVMRYRSELFLGPDPLDVLDDTVVGSCTEKDIKQAILSRLRATGGMREAGAATRAFVLEQLFPEVKEAAWRQVIEP